MPDARNLFLLILPLFFLNCATDSKPLNLIKPVNKGIKSITIYYQNKEKLDTYMETARKSIRDSLPQQDYSIIEDDEELIAALKERREQLVESMLEDYLFKDRHSEEYYDTYEDMEISRENWDLIINELQKPKKKKGIFSLTRNPMGVTYSISILYDNGKETKVTVFRVNYYMINDDRYYSGNRGGPDFKAIGEIIAKEQGKTINNYQLSINKERGEA